jgi:norsolorinic acid ketoreductase
MGNAGAASAGMDAAPVALEEGVKGIINEIDTATKETTSGKFASYDGRTLTW